MIPTLLHGFGVVLLYRARGGLPNQRMITLNLAVVEMLYCLFASIHSSMMVLGLPFTWKYYYVIYIFSLALFFVTTRFAIIHIIVDRFLDIWLNIKYPVYVKKKNLTIVIIFQWTLGIFLTVTSIIFVTFKRNPFKFQYMGLCVRLIIDVTIIFSAIITFAYLFSKVKSAVLQTSSQQGKKMRVHSVWFKMKIPLLMVTTFIAFNTSSTILFFLNYKRHGLPYGLVTYQPFIILDICGWCSDACIYIFLQKRVRRLLTCSPNSNWRKRNQVTDTQVTQVE